MKNSKVVRENAKQKKRSSREKGLLYLKTCPICGKAFETRKNNPQTYCSKQCYLNDTHCLYRKNSTGGFRRGSGRSKSGYYRGVYCGSTYELVWVIFQLDHNKEFHSFGKKLEYEGEIYYPDFFQDGEIIEIKGYHSSNVDKQIRVAKGLNYKIKVLYKKDLKKEFEYVLGEYNTVEGKLCYLYDDYKPKYKKTCIVCGKEYEHDNKNSKCCSLACGHLASAYSRKNRKN